MDSATDQIMWHESEADRLAGASDTHRWEAARLIAAELEAGKSQRQLAGEIGKRQPHVSYMAAAWRLASDNHGYQGRSFDSLYQEVKSKPKKQELAEKKPLAINSKAKSESSDGTDDSGFGKGYVEDVQAGCGNVRPLCQSCATRREAYGGGDMCRVVGCAAEVGDVLQIRTEWIPGVKELGVCSEHMASLAEQEWIFDGEEIVTGDELADCAVLYADSRLDGPWPYLGNVVEQPRRLRFSGRYLGTEESGEVEIVLDWPVLKGLLDRYRPQSQPRQDASPETNEEPG